MIKWNPGFITPNNPSASEAGGDLQNAIDRAVSIADELEVVNDSGNRLAAKLEALMDTARPMANPSMPQKAAPAAKPAPQPSAPQAEPATNYAQHLRKLDPADEKIARSTFAIRDADVERGIDPLDAKELMDDEAAQGLYSEAERDLFRAMKGKAKR